MSSDSESLTAWTTAQFSTLYAPHHDSHDNAHEDAAKPPPDLDAAFAPDAEIHLNHTRVDRAKFQEWVQTHRWAGSMELQCDPEDFIETPVEEGNPDAGTIVAGKATLVRTMKFRIRAAPAKNTTVISFSAKIQKNPKRQIVQLFQTAAEKPFKVVLPTPHAVDASAL
ncbi:hypothetical protein C8R47DRAFT_1132935 [Mycena vitilis]|nr:hypothetical protein C8R47DRAFT_1132935 [Mycena vitilis]